jgi:DNA-binding NtrC family response regulator
MVRIPRVLVVDDDETVATTLAMILSRNGFEAVATYSGTSALELAHAKHFDFLVTDVIMSPLDGVRTGVAFRNINPAGQVFLFTGTFEAARERLVSANLAWDFPILTKPLILGR